MTGRIDWYLTPVQKGHEFLNEKVTVEVRVPIANRKVYIDRSPLFWGIWDGKEKLAVRWYLIYISLRESAT